MSEGQRVLWNFKVPSESIVCHLPENREIQTHSPVGTATLEGEQLTIDALKWVKIIK
jgi:hypothetical protein